MAAPTIYRSYLCIEIRSYHVCILAIIYEHVAITLVEEATESWGGHIENFSNMQKLNSYGEP